jgi:CO/xanthine dehydrogenase Mo-binding subunit
VANAIHDAVGARLLQLPMTPARIQAALKRG